MPSDRAPHALPTFESVEDERRHRKQRLAAAFRLFGHFGFDEGVAGHITARDPELTDHFWLNPFGMNFKQIRVKDLILVNHQGDVVEGNWPVNTAAFVIHGAVPGEINERSVIRTCLSENVLQQAYCFFARGVSVQEEPNAAGLEYPFCGAQKL